MVKKRRPLNLRKFLEKEHDEIETIEKVQISKINKGNKKLEKIEREGHKLERLGKEELKELEDLKKIELQIRRSVTQSPLKRITSRDMARGLVGSFFGIVAHFAFIEGVDVVEKLNFTMLRATLLLITSFFIGLVFLYATGYREIKDFKILSVLPIRIFVIFGISIVSIITVLALFGFINSGSQFQEVYKQVAVISLPAIIGAATADLIGKRNE